MSKKIETTEEFKAKVSEIESTEGYRRPIMYGICRNDMGIANVEAVLQSTFIVNNVDENHGSAAILTAALVQDASEVVKKSNVVHQSTSEAVYTIDGEFLEKALDMFAPYIAEANDDLSKHLNVQAITAVSRVQEMLSDPMRANGNIFGNLNYTYRVVFIYEDTAVETVEAGYLKLYALSETKSGIRTLNLDGLFGKLTNCAWTIAGEPIELETLEARSIEMKAFGQYPPIMAVDKFPRMLQHVIPNENVRILDSSKVRMGAHLAAGTVVMPGASYINFNAGTNGKVMVEGRISSSAIVGANSDVGGGASILGVLSGTDGDPITVGEKCLLGANSTCGISLGNGCIIDAGVAILPGTKVNMLLEEFNKIFEANIDNSHAGELKKVIVENEWTKIEIKGSELSGYHGMHYRQDSRNGAIMVSRSTREVVLNSDLH